MFINFCFPLQHTHTQELITCSCGTSEGQGKYIPYFDGLKTGTLEVARIASSYINQAYPLSSGAKVVEFLFSGKLSTTISGLRLAYASTHLIYDDTYKMRQQIRGLTACSPDEVVFATSFEQGMYCYLLCGLVHRDDVEVLTAVFAHTLVEALRMLEIEWQSLCHDIRFGLLNENRVTDPSLRAAMMSKVLTCGNAHCANQVAAICEEKSSQCAWNGIIKRLWPRCKYVLSIMTGSMEAYVETLQAYAGEDVPLVSADYGASEGWIAANINPRSPPHQVSFTTIPTLGYFEFLPLSIVVENAKDAPSSSPSTDQLGRLHTSHLEATPINLDEVKLGHEYQIVMTTTGGLYRYVLEDMLRVTGFFHDNPQFAYVCRKNVILSINVDKVSEEDLKLAVQKAASVLRRRQSTMKLVEYSSYANTDNAYGHYVIFWEVQGGGETINSLENQRLLVECATLMDENFFEAGYVLSRKTGTIRPLELCIVKQGTFRRLMESFLVDKVGASITQFKTPRCINSKHFRAILSILQQNTIASYFSSATF
ncbi:hypothetical protein L7F22_011447 [Adiantum nelumboides]|nr:hypothetical protein [Adiantum nelumboides]